MTVPLYACTGKNMFHWGEEQQPAFDEVKLALASAPVLTLPTKEDYFILDTDASEFAIGAELSQIQTGVERTIALPCYLINDAIVPQKGTSCSSIFHQILPILSTGKMFYSSYRS